MKIALVFLGACMLTAVQAQTAEGVPEAIAKERAVLLARRHAIVAEFEQRSQACWQRFAVNDCISQARRVRRADLVPIRQAELALNEQERQWRTQQRNERVLGKQEESAVKP
jgi:hypothetical protein